MKALVIGGARSGSGVALLLQKHGVNVTLVSNADFEMRESLTQLGVEVVLNDRDMSLVKPYDFVVKNPGIPNDHPLVAKFETVLNEIEVAAHFAPDYSFYAVSGTNGKTTTVTMLAAMLQAKDAKALLAGNVGYALSEAVYHDGNFNRDVALEISAFQMEGTPALSPVVYGLMNLSPDHLDRYADAEAYYREKLSILPRVGTFIKNIDDANIVALTQDFNGKTLTLSLTQTADIMLKGTEMVMNGVVLFDTSMLKIVGKHNVLNAAMAAAMAYLASVSLTDIQSVLADFRGVEHRIEYVAEIAGVRYYNDSKATNPESTEVALEAFEKNIVLLAGGYDKHISFEKLRPYASRIKKAYLFGASAKQLQEVFSEAILVADMKEAFKEASAFAKVGDVVLLSPACASYDQFDDFEQRGMIFKDYIKTLQ